MNLPAHGPAGPEVMFKEKLVSAQQLLDAMFAPDSRPSIRWLRTQTKARTIPFFRIGHLIFFDVEMVRTALTEKNLLLHRTSYRASAERRNS